MPHRLLTGAGAGCLAIAMAIAAASASAQTPDLAEANAAQWTCFAPVDDALCGVADSTAKLKSGSTSILFTTQSGFDTGVKYPASANLALDASAYTHLTFWEWPENTTPIGWQGNQPVIVLHCAGGTITLTPDDQVTPNFAWRLFKVPLAGGNGWTRSDSGTPSLAHVNQIEIHHDTWDAGFRIYFDGVRFMHLDPNGLPPAGPPPPPGVDPDVIVSKVYLYILDPIMENFGSRRMHEVYGWQDPRTLTTQVMADLLASSHGRARFEIVESVFADEYPRFEDGFQHDDATFAADWANHVFHQSTFDYIGFCNAHQLGERVDAGEIDEVWIYAPPIGGMWESCMAGQGAYWINGPAYPAAGGQRVFPMMGWNFERGVGEAIHSFGHRAESTMVHCYGSWPHDRSNTWGRFALFDTDIPGQGGVGNVHFPVNATSDYDYANTRFVSSNADAWLSYPNLNNTTRSFNFHEWSPAGHDPQREYLNWWYAHMPHVAGRAPDFYLANWWRYLLDLEQFKAGGANLYLTLGTPSVRVTTPAQGASVRSVVRVVANAEVDGALGRVDFYVDGLYAASDYLAPYTFDWNSAGLLGTHVIVAKAYELQNGTEGVSEPVSVNVLPCFADLDDDGQFANGPVPDGGVDINDLLYFLVGFEAGDVTVDLDDGTGTGEPDAGVDINDLLFFLRRFEIGC